MNELSPASAWPCDGVCIYIVLVLLFKYFATATILVRWGFGGQRFPALSSRRRLSVPSMIGLIVMGIATKTSILLVERDRARRDHGLSRMEALLDACHKRARPIVMTTIAMGAGMMPIALGIGTDPSFRAPMAIVVIGGLITSTFLSLLVIPVLFTFVDDAIVWTRRRLRQRSGTAALPAAPDAPAATAAD